MSMSTDKKVSTSVVLMKGELAAIEHNGKVLWFDASTFRGGELWVGATVYVTEEGSSVRVYDYPVGCDFYADAEEVPARRGITLVKSEARR